jgi:hypothetical protein
MPPILFPSSHFTLHGQLHLPAAYQSGVLFLHGGGVKTNHSRYLPFQSPDSPFGQSIASLAFDFRGCGQSEGKFEQGSLQNRLQDAKAALNEFIKLSKLSESSIYLWGSSMGGHIACKLLEAHPKLKGIILQSAAAYSEKAEALPLNHQFTQAINQPNSWNQSPAFTSLKLFTGKVLIVYGDLDTVVPQGIQLRYQEIARRKDGQVLTLNYCPHALLKPHTPAQQTGFNQLLEASYRFVQA